MMIWDGLTPTASAMPVTTGSVSSLPRPSGDRYQDMKHLTGIGPVRDAD